MPGEGTKPAIGAKLDSKTGSPAPAVGWMDPSLPGKMTLIMRQGASPPGRRRAQSPLGNQSEPQGPKSPDFDPKTGLFSLIIIFLKTELANFHPFVTLHALLIYLWL